jgi:hypothetical protein
MVNPFTLGFANQRSYACFRRSYAYERARDSYNSHKFGESGQRPVRETYLLGQAINGHD